MIIYDPSKMLRKIAPRKKIERLVSSRASFKRSALTFLDSADFIDKNNVTSVVLKTFNNYKERIKSDSSVKDEILDDPRLLVQRVQNEVVAQITEEIRETYNGEKYIWLPSDAEEPDPEHQLNYGKEFVVGDGEMPGDRIGCRCGMQILTKDTKLNL